MTRQRDNDVPSTEALYRSLSIDDVSAGVILPHAVDMPQCSLNRATYSKPEDVFLPHRPEDNGIGDLIGDRLTKTFPRSQGSPYGFVVCDDPIPSNEAHCEVRLTRVGFVFSPNHKVDKAIKSAAQAELAKRMRIIKDPQ